MPVEAKPIFRPDVIRLPILGFNLPGKTSQCVPKLEKWAEIILGSGFRSTRLGWSHLE